MYQLPNDCMHHEPANLCPICNPIKDITMIEAQCPVCDSQEATLMGSLGHKKHLRCRACGTGFHRDLVQDCATCRHSSDNNGNCMGCDECDSETFDGWESCDEY